MFRDGHGVKARNPHAPASLLLVPTALLQQAGELRPRFRRRVLPAKLALAIPPAAGRNHAGKTVVDSSGINRNSRTEAVPDDADLLGIYLVTASEEGQRVFGVGHLVEAAHLAALAFAFAATAEIKPQRRVAHALEHCCLDLGMGFVLRSDEAVE